MSLLRAGLFAFVDPTNVTFRAFIVDRFSALVIGHRLLLAGDFVAQAFHLSYAFELVEKTFKTFLQFLRSFE